MKTRRFTTEQVAAVARGDWRDCEFTDIDGLRERFSIKRSLAYALLKAGAIKGVSLRKRGSIKGKRLFDCQSVRDYLSRQPTDISPEHLALTQRMGRETQRQRRERDKMGENRR